MEWLGKAIILNPTTGVELNKSQPGLLADDSNNLKIVHTMKPYNGSFALDGPPSISDNTVDIDFKYLGRPRKSNEFASEDVDQFTIELPTENISLDPDVLQDIRIISNHRNANILCVDMKDYLQEDVGSTVPILCRVCACESKMTYPLFKDGDPNMQLLEKIHQYLPIKISFDDDLPQQICDTCNLKLDICHNFIISSAEADAKLRAQSLAMKQGCKLLDTQKLDQTLSDISTIKIVDVHNNSGPLKELPYIEQGLNSSTEMEINLMESSFSDLNKQIESSLPPAAPAMECDVYPLQNSIEEITTEVPEEQTESMENEKMTMLQDPSKHSYFCQYCDKEFKTEVRKIKHEKTHTKRKKKVMCFVCEEVFPNGIALRAHLKCEHNQTKVYPCDLCDKTYSLLSSLDIHRATHSKETPYLCDLCGKKFKHISNLRSHKRSHLDESIKKRYACDQCPKTFHSKFQLSEHLNVHNDTKPYPCDVCGKQFHRRIQLRQHLLTHNGDSLHECPQCGLRFNRRGNMTQHLKRHGQKKVFLCKVCKNSFPSMAVLLAHRRQHTKEEIERQTMESHEPFKCRTCSKTFSEKETFEEHSKGHGEDQEFECSVCSKKLKSKRSLEYHKRSFHTGVKLFRCNHCGDGFGSKKACVVHERIHTGERPYQCELCPMAFRCASNLAQHVRSHTNEKPWSCDHCEKTFKRKEALVIHQRSHTGERPFCCDKCGRRFSQKNDMMRHQRSHCVVSQPIVCDECGLSFKEKRSLEKHMKEVHLITVLADNVTPVSILTSEAVVIATVDGTEVSTSFPISVVDGIILQHVDESGQPISTEQVFAEASLVTQT